MDRAFLVGINKYPGAPLNGCVNDITDMANFLVSKCGFAKANIRLICDGRATTQAILDRLRWLVNGLRKGDRVLFHYSGHGAQMPSRNPQGEVDKLDEVICPVDFDWSDAHAIRDKQFVEIFSGIPDGVEFVWVSDSCHSGDLTRDFKPQVRDRTMPAPADIDWRIQTAQEQKIPPATLARAAGLMNVALISGCKSNQTSADANFSGRANGALTYFLLQELIKTGGQQLTLTAMVKNVVAALKVGHYTQVPQVEGSAAISKRPFMASVAKAVSSR